MFFLHIIHTHCSKFVAQYSNLRYTFFKFQEKGARTMFLPFEELQNHNFQISDINIYLQTPIYRNLDVSSRKYNGFLCILRGEGIYSYGDDSLTISPGTIVYLPLGSVHFLTVTSKEFEFYRIDFKITIQNEPVFFSKHPLKITDSFPKECFEAIQTLYNNYRFVKNTVAKTEYICRIFRTLHSSVISHHAKRLAPAIRYIHEHLTDKINCHELASMCCLSTAQFYNVFHAEYNSTPLEYRDELLLHQAVLLLKNGEFSITEISEMLGFDSVAYFSRFFKKHQGFSPSKHR